MYLINYVNVVACVQVGSSPPSIFRGVRFTSCPVDQVFSTEPSSKFLQSSWDNPGALCIH